MNDFWKAHGLQGATTRDKYNSIPAAFYRAVIRAERDGEPVPVWEEFKVSHKPVEPMGSGPRPGESREEK